MRDFMHKNNKKLIIAVIALALLSFGYSQLSQNRADKENLPSGIEQDKKGQEKENEGNDNNEKNKETESAPLSEEKVEYSITNLNKKDGDVFSVPDDVSFTITPAVDKSKITLTSAEGVVLYTSETNSSDAKFTVHPEKKVTEGTQGELLVEGYVGSNVVIYQKIKVVF